MTYQRTSVGLDVHARSVVAAPSKLQRPAGDRVKTDKSDALHLARLLHLGEIVAVTVPDVETEAARDLVRAREDVRGELMSARHRVSKLLLRKGIVYYGGEGMDRQTRDLAAIPPVRAVSVATGLRHLVRVDAADRTAP